MNPRSAYTARINAVIDHIESHLDESLDLVALASVAHFSPWHFHRVFQAFTGEALGDHVRRRRLEAAAVRLLATPPATALSIALDVGFGSAEVFTRAFSARFGITPSAWRRGGHRAWVAQRRDQLSKIHQAHRKPDQALAAHFRDDDLTRPISGRDTAPRGHEIFGIAHDSPDITDAPNCRYDACVAVDASFRPAGGVGVQVLPGGLCACLMFRDTPDKIHAAWLQLMSDWLPNSGYQTDDRPAFEAYGPSVDADPKTGAFACRLCLPVRAA